MKKRLFALILIVCVPVLFAMSWVMSERSFTLSMEKEKKQTQWTQTLIFREIQKTMASMNYTQASSAARQYRHAYAAQEIELIFCWNKLPLADAMLPHRGYEDLIIGQRCAMLDTISASQRYAVAEPVNDHLTMILLRDVSDLYALRQQFRVTAMAAALGASLLLGLLTLLIAGFFTRPIRSLTKAARELSENSAAILELPTQSKDEIGTLALAFAQMRDAVQTREEALQKESAARQALLDALAHEMRTPLTSLMGNARLMQRELPPAERARIAESMVRETNRLTDMDHQLMKLTQLRQEPIDMQAVSILPLLRETQSRMLHAADGVTITVTDNDSIIPGDAALLSLLIDNLTINALRASSPGQTVTLSAAPGGFTVEDHGVGMTEEQLRHACEPFWKADKARTRTQGGAGLGLAISQRIAEMHLGTLSITSAPGEGTKAAFTTSLRLDADSVTTSVAE